ncbi:MAG: dehydrogenase, partial [Chloroflexi bacterium]|nr:dehydrogenase [Chloroflexota bacterium]
MSEWAVAVTAREQAELVPLEPLPELGRTQVRGHTLYTLISPGTELAWAYTGAHFPAYPGYAAVFQVEEVGPDVSDIAVGDQVFCMGRHQSVQQQQASRVVRLPKGLPPENAVIARLMGVTMTTIMTTTARPGDRVMVMGAGPVGYLGAQNARLAAYEVIVVEPNDARREMAARSGVSATFARAP